MSEKTPPDYRSAGWIGEITGRLGQWRRMPDEIRYRYGEGTMCRCPMCFDDAAGTPWQGWFWCELKDCCIALVDTGEVFVRVSENAAA